MRGSVPGNQLASCPEVQPLSKSMTNNVRIDLVCRIVFTVFLVRGDKINGFSLGANPGCSRLVG